MNKEDYLRLGYKIVSKEEYNKEKYNSINYDKREINGKMIYFIKRW